MRNNVIKVGRIRKQRVEYGLCTINYEEYFELNQSIAKYYFLIVLFRKIYSIINTVPNTDIHDLTIMILESDYIVKNLVLKSFKDRF